jgi:hypothetical protein
MYNERQWWQNIISPRTISPTEKFDHIGQTFLKEFLKNRQLWPPWSNFINKNNIFYNSIISIRIGLFGISLLHYWKPIYCCLPRTRKLLEHCWLWIKSYESSAFTYWWRTVWRSCSRGTIVKEKTKINGIKRHRVHSKFSSFIHVENRLTKYEMALSYRWNWFNHY